MIPESESKQCKDCNLRGMTKQKIMVKPVPSSGPLTANMMLVGRNPGKEENRQARPFVGPAGNLLNQVLSASSIERDDLYVTNVVKCYTKGDRPPTNREVNLCLPVLLQEIDEVNPKVLVAMGNEALWGLTSKTGIMNWRGSAWWDEELKLILVATLHPSFIMRGNFHLFDVMVADFKKAKRLLEQGLPDIYVEYITDTAEAELWYKQNFGAAI